MTITELEKATRKNPHAVALGRKGGKAKGKPKGFAAMTPEAANFIRQFAADFRFLKRRGWVYIKGPGLSGIWIPPRATDKAGYCTPDALALEKAVVAKLRASPEVVKAVGGKRRIRVS